MTDYSGTNLKDKSEEGGNIWMKVIISFKYYA